MSFSSIVSKGVTRLPTRPSWVDYFFSLATLVATRATCPRAHCGVVIVDPATHRVLATGYNGAPAGFEHCDDVGCWMENNHCMRSVHAEANAIASAARFGVRLDGAVAYVSAPLAVCLRCRKELTSAGITTINEQHN